jgi:hypothetical protein
MIKCWKCGAEFDEEQFQWCTKCWAPVDVHRSPNGGDEVVATGGYDNGNPDDVRLMMLEELRSVNGRVGLILRIAVMFGVAFVVGVVALAINWGLWASR